MNISGLSYLQYLLIDAFVAIYIFIHVHLSGNWSSIVPFSALRLDPQSRNDAFFKILGFYSSLVGTILFMVKDGIMAAQEIQDVRLCQASVYAREDVVPLDQQQLPDIERGLMLWNL
ncbi:hypothetical protein GGF37_001796, partial [Kickxella alabastrina]